MWFESKIIYGKGNPDICWDTYGAAQRSDDRFHVAEILTGNRLAALERVDFDDYSALLAGLIAKQVTAIRGVLIAENYDATGTDRPLRRMAVVIHGHFGRSSYRAVGQR
jgi:hypothetical protein